MTRTQQNTKILTALRVQFSYPVRAFLRAVVSNEPIFQIAHPATYDVLLTLTQEKWDNNTNNCQKILSFYGAIIYNLIVCAKSCALTLPDSFFALLNELATISKGVYVFFFSKKKNKRYVLGFVLCVCFFF